MKKRIIIPKTATYDNLRRNISSYFRRVRFNRSLNYAFTFHAKTILTYLVSNLPSVAVLGIFLIISLLSNVLANPVNYIYDKVWDNIITMDQTRRPKIALVLGGGGARGFAHVGVLEVLEEEKVPIDIIVGTSVGAFVGSLYAAGMNADQIKNIAAKIKWKDLSNLSTISMLRLMFFDRLLKTTNMFDFISKNIEHKQFYELNVPFACVAADIVTGEKVVIRDGDVATAVRASVAIPGIFKPVEYKQRFLVDGGIVANVPVSVAKELGADIIIAVNIEADYTQHKLKKVFQVMAQVSYIQAQRLNSQSLKNADFIFSPKVGHISILDMNRSGEAFDAGLYEARLEIDELKKLIVDNVIIKN